MSLEHPCSSTPFRKTIVRHGAFPVGGMFCVLQTSKNQQHKQGGKDEYRKPDKPFQQRRDRKHGKT
jgi:hypothetical protein